MEVKEMSWIIEIGKQVPALIVMAWLVRLFMVHMGNIAQAFLENTRIRDGLFAKHTEALEENTKTLTEVREVMRSIARGRP